MRGSIFGVLSVLSIASHASGLESVIITQVSSNGGATWSNSVSAASGATILVRVRVTLTETTSPFLGLANATFQPRASGIMTGDSILALTEPCHDVPAIPATGTGRVAPFASNAPLGGTDCLQVFADGAGALRIGQGDSTSIADTANAVPCDQIRQMLAGPNFLAGQDVVVFRYAVVVGSSPGCRAITLTVPFESVAMARTQWYPGTGGLRADVPLTPSNITPASIIINGPAPTISAHPGRLDAVSGGAAAFSVTANGPGGLVYQWRRDGAPLIDGPRVSGSATPTLVITNLALPDAGAYSVRVTNPCGGFILSADAPLTINRCPADVDDGSGSGLPDGGITIDDLLFYLNRFDSGC